MVREVRDHGSQLENSDIKLPDGSGDHHFEGESLQLGRKIFLLRPCKEGNGYLVEFNHLNK